MDAWVLGFGEMDRTRPDLVGGKGANLGELARIEGIRVPAGFCVTTRAFKRILGEEPRLEEMLGRLFAIKLDDRIRIAQESAGIRDLIQGLSIPVDIQAEITRHLSGFGAGKAFAVRSSATAEDGPTASFAGQQDTYLNLIGAESICGHIVRCWASLFTERAVAYRIRNGVDHRKVQVAVLVQEMVLPEVAGILFTADPVSNCRKILSIEAGFGLGESLVSGHAKVDTYQVRDGKIIGKRIASKTVAAWAVPGGGIQIRDLEPAMGERQALGDAMILELERLGRRIEAHFGTPQDVEWAWARDGFHFLQSRPITTLFPVPESPGPGSRVYLSVGHQQMMTDPILPLGLSVWRLTASTPMHAAGGRLFVDATPMLSSSVHRERLLTLMGRSDPLTHDALLTLLRRGDFLAPAPEAEKGGEAGAGNAGGRALDPHALIDFDPALVPALIENGRNYLSQLEQAIQAQSGPALIDFIREDLGRLRRHLSEPRSLAVILTAMNASAWINENLERWLGEGKVADSLSRSVPGNITSQMGLDLFDVADAIRPYPEVVAYLGKVEDEDFLAALPALEGGTGARDAIQAYLRKYGMRCAGEIDITRPRWSERPAALLPVILGHVRNFGPGEGARRFARGLREATEKEGEVLERLRGLPDGGGKAEEAKRRIALVRGYAGYREYPKYVIVSAYWFYKRALAEEAGRLRRAGILRDGEDIHYLSLDELGEVFRAHTVDYARIDQRKGEYAFYGKLSPPRVLTSEGEILTGQYRREDLPAGALAGLPVSSGMAEGRARIVMRLEDANLEAGDILVTRFTDPSWTPWFVNIRGLVTEVGGLMTHGAVIAREYGIPAVVGVEDATRRIRDGQWIRVYGTRGFVEILGAEPEGSGDLVRPATP